MIENVNSFRTVLYSIIAIILITLTTILTYYLVKFDNKVDQLTVVVYVAGALGILAFWTLGSYRFSIAFILTSLPFLIILLLLNLYKVAKFNFLSEGMVEVITGLANTIKASNDIIKMSLSASLVYALIVLVYFFLYLAFKGKNKTVVGLSYVTCVAYYFAAIEIMSRYGVLL